LVVGYRLKSLQAYESNDDNNRSRAVGGVRNDAAKQTIADGADVNAKDKDDFTSFHCAAAFGHKETAELLLRSITIASRDWGRYCAALPDSR
jgi:ankyrin repeat protein